MNSKAQNFSLFKKHLLSFVSLTDEEFETVLGYFKPEKIRKHQYLLRAGDYVKNTYWVDKGLLISSFIDSTGKEHIVQFAIENCWITDQNGFYNRDKAIFSIMAFENTEVLGISFENRERLCSSLQKMERFFRKKANDSFVKLQKRHLTYLTSDSEQRLNLLLEEYPSLFQRLTKKILAAYLGVSRETLSRARRPSRKSK